MTVTAAPRIHGKDAPLEGDEPMVEEFRTPGGKQAFMYVRPGTADHNNVFSCLTEDEYGLKSVSLGEGTALDIGAHVGGVTVGLALDNPQAHVIAVEALSANVEVLRANCEANGVADRVTIVHGAATKPGRKAVTTIRWNFDQTPSGQHHRFIGNGHGYTGMGGESEKVRPWFLPDVEIAFAKIDCELCEYDVLNSPMVKRINEIRGEFHSGYERIVELLNDTHVVSQTGGTEAFGAFRAVRR